MNPEPGMDLDWSDRDRRGFQTRTVTGGVGSAFGAHGSAEVGERFVDYFGDDEGRDDTMTYGPQVPIRKARR